METSLTNDAEKPDMEAGDGDDFQPMAVETEAEKESSPMKSFHDWLETKRVLPRRYELVTDEEVRKYSIWAVRFVVLASAINTKMLNPNFAIMVSPGLHPDSFPSTDPFDFNSATYFIPLCSLLGVAIASIFLGQISDKIGRKRVILVLAIVSTAGSVVKYLTKNTFWGFCVSNFVFGLFLGNLPVAMAYIGDVYVSKKQKEEELGVLVGNFVLGSSGGGIIAILMESSGLFTPLWVGAAIMGIASFGVSKYMVDPGDARLAPIGKNLDLEEDQIQRPEKIDQRWLWNVVGGAFADNIGSTGLFPLCLSPLALEQYLGDFVEAGEEPIMSLTGYKWLSVMAAIMVVPSTIITPYVFTKIGVAGTCVLGNALTALVTLGLLLIGNGPATTAYFAGFVTLMYGGFPFTVFSQLTTGPMLDVLAPEDKIGYVQGLNNASMNFGMAFAPWVLGILADAAGTNIAISVGIGISVLAAMINTPLMFHPSFGPTKKEESIARRPITGEDPDLVEKVLRGEFVPPEDLFELNRHRLQQRKTQLVTKVKPYAEEKESIVELLSLADATFQFRADTTDRILADFANPQKELTPDELCEMLNTAQAGSDPQVNEEATADLGQWIGDYLSDTGYAPHINSTLIKQMVLSAFPIITQDKEYTPENLEKALLRSRQVMNEYTAVREKSKYSLGKTIGMGNAPVFFS